MRKLDVEVANKQRQALEMRNLGASYERIAAELGYSDKSGAWRAVQAALDRAVIEPAFEQRQMMAERLDILLRRCLGAFLEGDLDQVRNVLAIEKRRAELFGLDAAKGLEITGPAGGPVQTDVGEMLMRRLMALAEGAEPLTPLALTSDNKEGILEAIEVALDETQEGSE